MSAAINTSPAFPSPGVVLPNGQQQGAYEGMALRDYFAAKAMQVLMAETKGDGDDTPMGGPKWEMHEVAALAYEQADAMLAARKGGAS